MYSVNKLTVIKNLFFLYMYSCTCTNSGCIPCICNWSRMLQMYILKLKLVDGSATLGGMAHSLSKESDSRAIFNPENYYMLTFVHSWASSKKTNFQWLHIHFPSHMHMHTLVKHHLFTFSLYSICHSQCGVTFWWKNYDHGSLSSPWRMDLIHSILVCAFVYTTDQLSWSIFGLYGIHLHHSVQLNIDTVSWVELLGRNVFRVPHKCSKLNGCMKQIC